MSNENVFLVWPTDKQPFGNAAVKNKNAHQQVNGLRNRMLLAGAYQMVLNVDDTSVLPPCLKFVTEVDTSCCQHTPVYIERAPIHHKCHITQLTGLQKSEIVH
jgi:hypothetical protein